MNFDFKNISFLNLLKSKKTEIIDKANDEIQESPGFKIFIAGLRSMLASNAFNGLKIISISEEEIINITLESIGDFDDLFGNTEFVYNNVISLNRTLSILQAQKEHFPEDSASSRNYFSSMSNAGNIIFLLVKNKINYFVCGKDKSESPFFSLADVNAYNLRKNMSEINDVFNIYQESLRERRNYCKFFIELSHLKSLYLDTAFAGTEKKFIIDYSHLLRNKPEDTFRDDLRQFLSTNLRVSQVKEFLLENMKRLDIFLYDDYGEVYLIEVKWVGQSIHQSGKDFGTSFDNRSINPAAFLQTLDYLEELANKGQNIVRAFLVVFDARKEILPDTGEGFDSSILNDPQPKHYRKFEKMRDLRVVNFHPS